MKKYLRQKKIYYCNQCKKIKTTIKEVYFVEQGHLRAFCSEECIRSFFKPLSDFFHEDEKSLRTEIKLEEEIRLSKESLYQFAGQTLGSPDEIWIDDSELNEELYYFIKKISAGQFKKTLSIDKKNGHKQEEPEGSQFFLDNSGTHKKEKSDEDHYDLFQEKKDEAKKGHKFQTIPLNVLEEQAQNKIGLKKSCQKDKSEEAFFAEDFYFIIVAYTFNEGPSYIIHQTMTKNKDLIERYQVGEQIDSLAIEDNLREQISEFNNDAQEESEIDADEKLLEIIENFKSSYLDGLLKLRKSWDVPFENFGHYESYLKETISFPDEVYQYKEEGEDFFVYIKGLDDHIRPFYYIVICMDFKDENALDNDTVIPIISFPSFDGELCQNYKRGQKVSGNQLN